jgi:hypothetical protein
MGKEKFEDVDPEIKKEIIEEGFEDNTFAVLIGKEEEMPQLLEKLEKEGRAENLGSYIKMHKEIALPKEEINLELKKVINVGLAWFRGIIGKANLRFVDKEGNIAEVRIITEKIASLKESVTKGNYFEDVEKELTELGFDLGPTRKEDKDGSYNKHWNTFSGISRNIENYHRKIEDRNAEKELTITDNNGFVISPISVKPINENDTVILPETFSDLIDFTCYIGIDLQGSSLTLDSCND